MWRSNKDSHALELIVPPAETVFAYVHKRDGVFLWQAWRPFGGMFAYGEGADLEAVKKAAEKAASVAVFIDGVTEVVEAPKEVFCGFCARDLDENGMFPEERALA